MASENEDILALSNSFANQVTINNNTSGNHSNSNSENEDDGHSVIIDIEDKALKCDRRMLVQHSKYFEALFKFQSGSNKRIRINGGIDHEAASIILSAMAGADVVINGENAQSILQASTFLQCAMAEQAAADFILSNLTMVNAFSVFLLGLHCGSVYLSDKSEHYILQRVQTFHKSMDSAMDILTMTLEDLVSYLNCVSDNGVALGVIGGWVLYDPPHRQHVLSRLLKTNIVIEIVPPESYEAMGEQLEDDPVIIQSLESAQHYDQMPLRSKMKHWDSGTSSSALDKWPRISIACSTGNNASLIAYRSPQNSKWLKLTTKPFKLNVKSSGSVVAAVHGDQRQNQSLYFIGGVGNLSMWSYNLKMDSWKQLSAEQEERIRPLVCGVKTDIFVFGGYTDARKEVRYLDTACRFDTLSGKWSLLSPMECSRSGGQACEFEGNIYLFGGLCSRRRAVVSCEVYNIAEDEFKPLTNLPRMVIDFGLILVRSQRKVYIIGGMDPITFETKNTVLTYDLDQRKWSFDFPSLNLARKSCGCHFDGHTMYVVAGSTAELDQLSSVERYNPSLKKWEVIESLPKGLAASTTSVVVDLPVRLMANYRELGQSTMSS